jgi:hypothetical protein
MRQLNTVLILLLFLSSCIDKKQQRIEGDWLGYERTFVLENDTVSENFHIILSINQDSIRAINFKYISHGNRDSLFLSSYLVSGDKLIVTNNAKSVDTLTIDLLNDTFMILANTKNQYKYYRLSRLNTKSQKVDLVGKMFSISDSIQVIDTVEFLTNSTLLTYNLELERPNQIYEWRVRNYLDCEFLIIDSHEMPVFLIDANDKKHYKLKRSPHDKIEYDLNSIDFQKKLSRNLLFGKWVGKSNVPDKFISFKFSADSVQLDEFTGGQIVTGTYSLNLNGTKLFCFHEHVGEIIFYEIENFRNDSMFLNRLAPIKDSFILTSEKLKTAGNK